MLNNYETVFIMTPVLSDEQAKETVSKYKQLLASNGAKLVHEESWGLKNWLTQFKRNPQDFTILFSFKHPVILLPILKLTSSVTSVLFAF